MLTTPALAITETEVEAQVSAQGKAAVAGNVLIWFLCAVAFLKVSQKIDSFMASLGVNVGHTGSSMLADVLIAARGVGAVAGATGHAIGSVGRRASSSASGTSAAASPTGFFKGGLSGMVSRKVTNDAVKTATTTSHAVSAAKETVSKAPVKETVTKAPVSADSPHADMAQRENAAQAGGENLLSGSTTIENSTKVSAASHTENISHTRGTSHSVKGAAAKPTYAAFASPLTHRASIGGTLFAKSLASGGSFANDVIGTVAQGNVRSVGTITGNMASQALSSYMGITAMGPEAKDVPSFSNVEIGGGRITGIETAPGGEEGIAFGMYHADQYAPPQGEYATIYSADGVKWYKQYAQDAIERKPYMAPDNTVAYHERIVKKLPDPPKRKERL